MNRKEASVTKHEYTQSLKRESSRTKKPIKKLLFYLAIIVLFLLASIGLILTINIAKGK